MFDFSERSLSQPRRCGSSPVGAREKGPARPVASYHLPLLHRWRSFVLNVLGGLNPTHGRQSRGFTALLLLLAVDVAAIGGDEARR